MLARNPISFRDICRVSFNLFLSLDLSDPFALYSKLALRLDLQVLQLSRSLRSSDAASFRKAAMPFHLHAAST
jgi:hypothetical protein